MYSCEFLRRPLVPVLSLLMLLLATGSVFADANIEKLSERLIQLRGEVDDLSNELALLREEHKQRIKYLFAQENEAKAAIDREQKQRNKLKAKLEANRKRIRQAGLDSEQLKPILLAVINDLSTQINTGLPFKREERLAELEELSQQLQADLIPSQKGATRMWSFMEDELRLRRENGIFKQIIMLDGDEMLAEVARLGMVMMYFRTGDGRIGKVQQNGDVWQYHVLNSDSERKQIESLMDAFQKQIRSGYFELPNAFNSDSGV